MSGLDRLRVFVASSSEQIKVAEKVADAIKAADQSSELPLLDVCVWREGIFDFSSAYIESLERELDCADFAVVVLTGDDSANVRDTEVNLPRDNVIFELGLFIGRLGRKRCFFFVDGESDTRVASDLSGVKPVEFFEYSDNVNRPLLKTQAGNVLTQIRQSGRRYKPSIKVRNEQERLWRFSTRISGSWWERMRKGEDDISALSYLIITVDEATNTPKLEGRTYDTSGEYVAEWKSVISGVELSGRKPIVYYRWEGEFDETIGQRYGGGGRIIFDDIALRTAKGYFYDTNYASLQSNANTQLKRFGLYRCESHEVDIMKHPWKEDARSLVMQKIATLKGR